MWTTEDERRNLQLTALTYRGEAIGSARKELLRYIESHSHERSRNSIAIRQSDWEVSLTIVLRLLQLDYRFARDCVHSHFLACRRLLRNRLPSFSANETSIRAFASAVRNPHLHHIMITFECAHSTLESIIWDDVDVEFFRQALSRLVSGIKIADEEKVRHRMCQQHFSSDDPRIPRKTLLWRCLAKKPGTVTSNIYGDISEAIVQLGSLLVLCSVFLDYTNADASTPEQCIEELENSLYTLGESEALSSALNVSWLLGGGVGLPLERRRERLWLVSGILYALKVSSPLDVNGALLGIEDIKQQCLCFLGHTVARETTSVPVDIDQPTLLRGQ
ncbi:hypothetical protein BDV59DRAFT_185906 [Aspergillus ambiguus]|uniref:uncharacterized protein n=1 Tax=Aspergillus ambiguus TaxID=176160 RepID=UPI003CCC94D8